MLSLHEPVVIDDNPDRQYVCMYMVHIHACVYLINIYAYMVARRGMPLHARKYSIVYHICIGQL